MEIREHKAEANIEKADHVGTFFSPSTNLDGSEINDSYLQPCPLGHSLLRPNHPRGCSHPKGESC